jgi:hypothetical protein
MAALLLLLPDQLVRTQVWMCDAEVQTEDVPAMQTNNAIYSWGLGLPFSVDQFRLNPQITDSYYDDILPRTNPPVP